MRALRWFEAPHGRLPVYFWLNVEHGMKEITLVEWKWPVKLRLTREGRGMRRKVEGIVEALRKGCGAQISYLYSNSTNHPRSEAATSRLSPGTTLTRKNTVFLSLLGVFGGNCVSLQVRHEIGKCFGRNLGTLGSQNAGSKGIKQRPI